MTIIPGGSGGGGVLLGILGRGVPPGSPNPEPISSDQKMPFSAPVFRPAGPVPGKPISVNRGLNRLNPGIKFILRLISVPESTISTIQRINQGLNLTHLERSMNSLIGE